MSNTDWSTKKGKDQLSQCFRSGLEDFRFKTGYYAVRVCLAVGRDEVSHQCARLAITLVDASGALGHLLAGQSVDGCQELFVERIINYRRDSLFCAYFIVKSKFSNMTTNSEYRLKKTRCRFFREK